MFAQFADDLGNKIFALETNLEVLKNRAQKAGATDVADVVKDMTTSLEELKELKQKMLDMEYKVNYTADGVMVGIKDTIYYWNDDEIRVLSWGRWFEHWHPDIPFCYSTEQAAKNARSGKK